MTYRNDDQSFEDTLHTAVRNMHQHMPRGNEPSGIAWNIFATEAGIPTENATNKQTSPHSPKAKDRPAGTRETKSASPTQPGSHLGWSTWLAVALVLIVVGASANFLMSDNNGGSNISEHSIALAPGTPDMSVFTQLQVATPFASPSAYLPEYGAEYACHAEPLTEDQVFDIVMNPLRERVRRGSDVNDPRIDKYHEDNSWLFNQVMVRQSNSMFVPVEDQDMRHSLIEATNQFWNCMMTGTSFQMWALMDPSNVQQEILTLYPVIRDEATLRQHIVEWGPRPYTASLNPTFPASADMNPVEVGLHADESYESIIVQPSQLEGDEYTWARVRLLRHPDSSLPSDIDIQLEFTRAADGTWWARTVLYNQN